MISTLYRIECSIVTNYITNNDDIHHQQIAIDNRKNNMLLVSSETSKLLEFNFQNSINLLFITFNHLNLN